jgi:hypothetical protein
MWGRRRWSTALATLVTVAGLVACGGSSGGGSVKGDVLTGIDGIASADRLTTTIRLDTTPSALQALAQSSGTTLDSRIATALAGASIVIERAKSGSGSELDIQAVAGGTTLVELRAVDKTLFLKGDVRGILTLIGKPEVYANLKAETDSMPSFVQAAVTGQWVSLPAATLDSLSTLTGGAPASSAPGNGPKLLDDLKRAIDKDVTATTAGTDARGTHYVLHADTKALADDLRSSLSSSLPGGSAVSQRLPANVKHQNFTFDAWVKGGSLSELTIDLLQFGDTSKVPSGATLPLSITFTKTGEDIGAPTGASPVDLTQLGTLIGALQGGGSGG